MSKQALQDSESEKSSPVRARQYSRRSRVLLATATTALLVIIALALGLGLGLGLKKHNHSAAPTPSSPSASPAPFSSLQPVQQSNFVLNGLQGQPAQDRVYNFTIAQVNGAPDGVSKPMLVVNGMFPGPTIEANQGDRVIVNVTNQIENATSIHWHGLFQNQTNYYDGTAGITECGIPPGQSLVYNFTFGSFSGTTWYHAHSTEYTDGVTGALVVHPSDPAPAKFSTWDEEIVVQMNDLYHDFSTVLLAEYLSLDGIEDTPGNEPVPDAGTLNGLGQWGGGGDYFNFSLEANKTYRVRLVNTGSFAAIRFSLDYHPLTVIEADGTLVTPYVVTGVVVQVAQRYSVLIHTNQTEGNGTYWMRTELQTDMFTYDQPGQNTDIRGIVRYGNGVDNSSLPVATDDPGVPGQNITDMDTSLLVPAVKDVPPERTKLYTVRFSFENDATNNFLAFMNYTSWEPLQGTTTLLSVQNAFASGSMYAPEGSSVEPGDQFMITEDAIQVVDLVINNEDDGDHPFHLHGHRPYIMGTGVGHYIGQSLNEVNPLRRDTFLIPAYSWMIIRFVTDNPGLWALHCHISWHMAAGLLMQINSLPSVSAKLDVPQAIIDQCKAEAQ